MRKGSGRPLVATAGESSGPALRAMRGPFVVSCGAREDNRMERHGFVSGIALAVACAVLAGCGGEAPREEAGAPKKPKVAAVYATPIEEPWDGCIHAALLRAKDELGVEYEWAESVANPDFERVVREFAVRGFSLVMGDAFGSEEAVRRAARDFPRVAFCFGSGLKPQPPNFSVFDNWIHEPAYLSGMIAGRLTKTNVVGAVGGYSVPEVNRLVNAFFAGAKAVNPKVRAKVVFINSWFDPPKAKEAVFAEAALGADVFFGERYGVIEACREKGLLAFSNMQVQSHLAPEHVVTGPVWDMWPTVREVIGQVKGGTYTAQDFAEWSMMRKGGASLAPYNAFESKLEPKVQEMVAAKRDEILSGRFTVPVNERVPLSE